MPRVPRAVWSPRRLVAALGMMLVVVLSAVPALAEDMSGLQAEGQAAVEDWVGAVVSGDVDRIAAVLAPEFQILRADGSAYDRDAYLKSDLPRFPHMPEISGLMVTGAGDLLVARYLLSTGGAIDDGPEKPKAPRLTVFRRSGDAWLVVAHANFAAQ